MTHQDKIAFIRQKAIEANPEIVELKFGCEVVLDKNKKSIALSEDLQGRMHFFSIHHPVSELQAIGLELIKNGEIKIIGRPVRLADVLLAIGNHQDKWRETNWFTWVFPVAQELGKSGEWANFCGYSHDKGWALLTNKDKCPVGWNLRADDLEDQSEDTIEFIYSLLK